MQHTMSAAVMETRTECQAGNYGTSAWFLWIATMINAEFPGAGDLLISAAAVIPWATLWTAIQTAYTDLKSGKDFLTALKDALDQFVVITPSQDGPKMAAKPA